MSYELDTRVSNEHERKESNLQPADLESAALPIELRSFTLTRITDKSRTDRGGKATRSMLLLTGLFVLGVLPQLLVVLAQLKTLGPTCFLGSAVIAISRLRAFQPDVFAHSGHSHSKRRTARLEEPGG